MKKEAPHEIVQEVESLKYVLDKGPLLILADHEKLLSVINLMISTSTHVDLEISKAADLSMSQYYRRKNNPSLWTTEELKKIFKFFKFKK